MEKFRQMNKEDFLTDLYSELIPTIRQKHNMSTEQALCACFENFNKLQEWDLSLFVLDEILELDPNNELALTNIKAFGYEEYF